MFSDEQTIKNLTTRFKDEESELRNKFHVCRLCITRHRPMRYLPITNPGTVDVGVGYSGIPGHDFTPCTDDADLAFAFLLLEDLERVDASLLSVDVLRNQPHHHQRIVKGRGDAVSFRSYPCTSSFAYRVCPLRRIPEAKGSERKKVHLCPEQCSPCSGERFLDSHVTILWMKDAEAMENMTKRGGISVCRNCMCNLSHEHVQPNVSKSICSARAERVGSAHVIPVALLLEGGDDMDQVLNGDHVVCRRCVHECKDAPRRGLIYIEAPNTCPSYDPEAITILFLANERVRRVMRGGYNCHVCGDCADGIGEHLHYKPEEEERKALRKSKVCDLSSEIVVAFFHESQIGVVTGRGLSPAWIEEEPHLHADPVLGRKKLIPCSGSREEPHIIPDIVPPKAILPAPSVATVPSTASTESTASAGGSGKKTSKVAKGEKRK
ncbi:MAG: hypothetical protein OXF02_07670 [Simkaniaceae bacterium]|nr:hypothetical protein [Simkaniaceae bacterium]